jgi:hypothetical protein
MFLCFACRLLMHCKRFPDMLYEQCWWLVVIIYKILLFFWQSTIFYDCLSPLCSTYHRKISLHFWRFLGDLVYTINMQFFKPTSFIWFLSDNIYTEFSDNYSGFFALELLVDFKCFHCCKWLNDTLTTFLKIQVLCIILSTITVY